MKEDKKLESVNSLSNLRKLLTQDKEGLERYIYSRLSIGDVWWISDQYSSFGTKSRHPWVVVKGYASNSIHVTLSPRTTSTKSSKRGIITPANLLPELDQEGIFLLDFRRTFPIHDFTNFDYIGQLSNEWVEKIREFYQKKWGG